MGLIIKEIKDKAELRSFIEFPDKLYRDCQYYIPALKKGQMSTLSSDLNPAFEYCEARYWVAMSGADILGRVAAIINHKYNKERNISNMRFGWFDCIDDEKVSEALLRSVENWAKERGMEYIHGPLGFTSFDRSGILVEGFQEMPTTFGNYNYPYYDGLLKKGGYEKEVDWLEYEIKVPPQLPQKVINIAGLVSKRYSIRNANLNSRTDLKKYARQLFGLLNIVYKDLLYFTQLNEVQIEKLSTEFTSMIHPDYISIILNDHDEVVAFGIIMPSLGKAIKKSGGKMFPFGILRILWALRYNTTVDFLLIGVKPEYQNKGVNALIFAKIANTMFKRGIKLIETNRELENNQKVQLLWGDYERRQHKRARCYVKRIV